MSSDGTISLAFHRLSPAQLEELCDFTVRDDLLVKGLDRSNKRPYRAGCLPYLGLVAAGGFGFLGESLGMPKPVAVGFALTCAVLATLALLRSFAALRRSRDLLAREEGWHALAWTSERLCYRSLETCLLLPWDAVEDIQVFERDEGRFLGNTLWLHLEDKQRVLVAPRSEDGRFAGRTMADWHQDLSAAWTKATGRRSSAGASS